MRFSLFILIISLIQTTLFAQDDYAIIGATDVRMRSEPNLKSETIGKAQLGQVARVLDQTSSTENIKSVIAPDAPGCTHFYWYEVEVEGKKGWIFGAFVFHLSETKEIITSAKDLHVATAFTGGEGDGGWCVGNNFLVILDKNFKASRKAFTIDYQGEELSYRNMPSLNLGSDLLSAFENEEGVITIVYGTPEMPVEGDFAETGVLKLYKNGNSYKSKEKFYTNNRE